MRKKNRQLKIMRDFSRRVDELEAMKAKLFIFDVDHTITSRSTGVRMGQDGVRQGHVSRWVIMKFPLYYLRYRAGVYNLNNLPGELAPFVGITKRTLESWGTSTFDRIIKNDIFPEVEELIKHLRETGKHVILCTSSVDFMVKHLAEYLKIDEVIATKLGFDGDVCNGKILGMPAFGEGKVHLVNDYIKEHGIAKEDVAFFSDSINDLPLLKEVGFPVPTNPDRPLRRRAKESNWPFLDYRT